jgi:hypothetical protein
MHLTQRSVIWSRIQEMSVPTGRTIRSLARRSGVRRKARDVRALVRGTFEVLKARRQASSGLPSASVCIGRHLACFDNGRYAYLLTRYLGLAGYAVHVRATPGVLIGLGLCKFTRMMLAIPDVQFTVCWQRDHALFVTDDERRASSGKGLRRMLKFGTLLTTEEPRRYDMLFPYMMHPLYYHQGMHEGVAALRLKERRMRLVFSGNSAPSYENEELRVRFGKLSRPEVLQTAKEALSESQIRWVTTDEELSSVQVEGSSGFVHVENRNGFRVPKDKWLTFLAAAEFFLACPGLVMPLAHNLIEAMSVGSIPVTESPEFFDPPLQHGVNCVAFSGADDLAQKVRWVVETASAGDVAAIREGAVRYYEKFLTPASFGRRLAAPYEVAVIGMNFID